MCDQQRLRPAAHTRSLIRAFASHLNILWILSYWLNIIWRWRLYMLIWVYIYQNATLLEIRCHSSNDKYASLTDKRVHFIIIFTAVLYIKHTLWLPNIWMTHVQSCQTHIIIHPRLIKWPVALPEWVHYTSKMSRGMRFPTMWHFDMCRLRRLTSLCSLLLS